MELLRNLDDLLQWEISQLYYSLRGQLTLLEAYKENICTPGLKGMLVRQGIDLIGNISTIDDVVEELSVQTLNESSAMTTKSLVSQGLDNIELTTSRLIRDASIISAMQSFYHHNIARLIMARVYSCKLGHQSAEHSLSKILDELLVNDEELNLWTMGPEFDHECKRSDTAGLNFDHMTKRRFCIQTTWPQ